MSLSRPQPGYPPMGRRVRLLRDYQVENPLDLQPGDEIVSSGGKMSVRRGAHVHSVPVIPADSVGEVQEGPYCSGVFDYTRECPVQFDINDPMVPKTLGVPWELLEFVD